VRARPAARASTSLRWTRAGQQGGSRCPASAPFPASHRRHRRYAGRSFDPRDGTAPCTIQDLTSFPEPECVQALNVNFSPVAEIAQSIPFAWGSDQDGRLFRATRLCADAPNATVCVTEQVPMEAGQASNCSPPEKSANSQARRQPHHLFVEDGCDGVSKRCRDPAPQDQRHRGDCDQPAPRHDSITPSPARSSLAARAASPAPCNETRTPYTRGHQQYDNCFRLCSVHKGCDCSVQPLWHTLYPAKQLASSSTGRRKAPPAEKRHSLGEVSNHIRRLTTSEPPNSTWSIAADGRAIRLRCGRRHFKTPRPFKRVREMRPRNRWRSKLRVDTPRLFRSCRSHSTGRDG